MPASSESLTGFTPLQRSRPAVSLTDASPRPAWPLRDVLIWTYRCIVLAGVVITALARFDTHYVPREVFVTEIRALNEKLDLIIARLPR